jgi:hypothetical protein
MRRISLYLLGLALALGVILSLWNPWTPRVILTISEIHRENGQNWATLLLENRSSRPIFYEGGASNPWCHFSERTTQGVVTDTGPNPVGVDWRKAPELPPGQRLVFRVELQLGSRGSPITNPFKVAIKWRTSPHPPPPSPFRNLPILGKWIPNETLLWTPESQLK